MLQNLDYIIHFYIYKHISTKYYNLSITISAQLKRICPTFIENRVNVFFSCSFIFVKYYLKIITIILTFVIFSAKEILKFFNCYFFNNNYGLLCYTSLTRGRLCGYRSFHCLLHGNCI